MVVLVKNNAFSTLASGIDGSVTSITVAAGTGSLFPAAGGADYFYATLINTSNQLEIVKVTSRSTDTLTVVRAQDGTTARAYSSGARIELRVTAALLADIRDSITPADGTVTTAKIVNDNVTYAKIQNVSATSRILGRKSVGVGDVEEATLSEVLDFIGSAAQGDILYRGASAWARLPAGTANQVLRTAGAGANPSWSNAQTLATSQSLTGSTITFSSIPTGVRQIEVTISGMSLSAASGFRLRLGTSSGLATSGYNSVSKCIFNDSGGGGNIQSVYSNTSFICLLWDDTSYLGSGTFTLTNVTGNTWVVTHTLGVYLADMSSGMTSTGGGTVALGGTLDRVALVPVSGTFNAGTANILYTVT